MRRDINEYQENNLLSGHIQFHECLHFCTSIFISSGNSLRTQEPSLFSGIPVEFDRSGWLEACCNKNSQPFDQIDSSGAIIIRARRPAIGRTTKINRIHVRANNCDRGWRRGSSDLCNDWRLSPAVAVKWNGDIASATRDLPGWRTLDRCSPLNISRW